MKCSIGLDFGTLSVRALLLDIETGDEVFKSTFVYPHGVMDKKLPDGTELDVDWALQHPQDYIDGLVTTVLGILKGSKIDKKDIIGIGVDFTACSMLPILVDGTPLCFLEKFKGNPHAYVKLWKHHAANKQAKRMTDIALERDEPFIKRMGGGISSEWLFPKILETLECAPEIYYYADRFVEACDWIVELLTGKEIRNSCAAGFKAFWDESGFPSKEYFDDVKIGFGDVIGTKVLNNVFQTGSLAGGLIEEFAERIGLNAGIAVAVGVMDAHSAFPSLGITDPGIMMSIIGTSSCHEVMVDTEDLIYVPGMCGASKDGLLPGYYCYEMGQAGVGDSLNWFVNNCVTDKYEKEAAKDKDIGLHAFLNEKAIQLKPGKSGLIAMDWFNGNRSILNNSDLSGLIIGCTVQTKPEEIYRALIEGTAFGMRVILETFKEYGIKINGIVVCGGIGEKSKMAMQIYADILGVEIKLARSTEAAARGAAIYGACAAGKKAGGFDDQYEAVRKLGAINDNGYKPKKDNQPIYDKLFLTYKKLHNYFGIDQNCLMQGLKEMKRYLS